MDEQNLTDAIDGAIDNGLEWLNDHGADLFDAFRSVLDGLTKRSNGPCSRRFYGRPSSSAVGLAGREGASASRPRSGSSFAPDGVVAGDDGDLGPGDGGQHPGAADRHPLGIVASFNPRLNGVLPVLDMIQTCPPTSTSCRPSR